MPFCALRAPFEPRDEPKTATGRPKTLPRRPKLAPGCAQDGTRTVKEAMLSQGGLRKASERESIENTNENQWFFLCCWVGFGRPRRPQGAPQTQPTAQGPGHATRHNKWPPWTPGGTPPPQPPDTKNVFKGLMNICSSLVHVNTHLKYFLQDLFLLKKKIFFFYFLLLLKSLWFLGYYYGQK